MKIYKKWISIFIWIAATIVLWQLVAWLLDIVWMDPMAAKKVPYPGDVLWSFSAYGLELIREAGVTASRAVLGLLLGTGAGALLALLMSASHIIEKIALPYLLLSQMIPILGLAPVIFGLIKDIDASRIVIAAYITFFPVAISFLSGLRSVPADNLALMKSYAATGYDRYRKLMIPFALPYLFTGLKIAAPMSVTASILVDTLSAKNGIGYQIVLTLYGGGTAGKFWPAVLTAACMGIVSFALMTLLEYIIIPWKRADAQGGTAG